MVLYSRPDCHLCAVAKPLVVEVARDHGVRVEERNVEDDPRWEAASATVRYSFSFTTVICSIEGAWCSIMQRLAAQGKPYRVRQALRACPSQQDSVHPSPATRPRSLLHGAETPVPFVSGQQKGAAGAIRVRGEFWAATGRESRRDPVRRAGVDGGRKAWATC
ncbi:MAG: glutaredoxin family protein [Planctomycetes bacterium]|nr:glutaredoxin family protein [Planctomycetota bacterium]